MITATVPIKPMSINRAKQGRTFKTPEYKKFETDCLFLLPKLKVPTGRLRVDFEFGFSNAGQDLDSPLKLVIDVMQKKYQFNDNMVYELTAKKVIVKKGKEYWRFEIHSI